MWQANKVSVILLLIGIALLGGAHLYLLGVDALLARKVLSGGLCLLLLGVGSYAWLTARKGQ